ncbi:13389_t:CDS:2, partial [Entrophospora sp. SA101]
QSRFRIRVYFQMIRLSNLVRFSDRTIESEVQVESGAFPPQIVTVLIKINRLTF